jgi:hypothetical protein
MGWCSGTEIFDEVAEIVLQDGEVDKEAVLLALINVMRSHDWDCEGDSEYFDHPVVDKIFRKLEPEWYEDED